jgi:hypothetical protein
MISDAADRLTRPQSTPRRCVFDGVRDVDKVVEKEQLSS